MRLLDGPALTVATNGRGVGDFAITRCGGPQTTRSCSRLNPVAEAPGGSRRRHSDRVTTPGPGEGHHSWHRFARGPGLSWVRSSTTTSHDSAHLALQSLDGGQRWIPKGRGSYGRVVTRGDGSEPGCSTPCPRASCMAAAIDLDRLELLGRPVPCLQGVLVNMSGGAHYSLSDTHRPSCPAAWMRPTRRRLGGPGATPRRSA